MKILRRREVLKLSVADKIESEYPFLLLYLKALVTKEILGIDLLKMAAEKRIFKNTSRYLKRIIELVTKWRYSQAEACVNLSRVVPSKNLKNFLYRLSQSINSGEPMEKFIDREYRNFSASYYEDKMQAIERLRTLGDSFLSFESATLFLCVTILISSIFFSPELMITLSILTVVSVSSILFLLSWYMFKLAKPDGILAEAEAKPKQRRRIEVFGLASLIIALAIAFFASQSSKLSHCLVSVGVPMLTAGALGKIYVSRVKKREEEYPAFLRYIASICAVEVPVIVALKELYETRFKYLNRAVKRLYAKLKMRVEPRIAWWSFEVELDSKLIQRINEIMVDTLYVGNLAKIAKTIENFYFTYMTVRRKRYQVVSYLVNILIPLYAAVVGVLAVISGFFSALSKFMNQVATLIPFLTPPPVSFINMFFIFVLVILALNNSIAIYSMEGDSRFTILFYVGLFLTIGGAIYSIINTATHHYLSTIITL